MGLKNRSTLQEKLYWSGNCDLEEFFVVEDQKVRGGEGGREREREAARCFFPAPIPAVIGAR